MSRWLRRLLSVFLSLLLSVLPLGVQRAVTVVGGGSLSGRPAVAARSGPASGPSGRPGRAPVGLCVRAGLRPPTLDLRVRTLNAAARVDIDGDPGVRIECVSLRGGPVESPPTHARRDSLRRRSAGRRGIPPARMDRPDGGPGLRLLSILWN